MQVDMPRVAVITGASSGIGKELAIQLAQDGIQVVLVSRSMEKLDKIEYNIKSNGGQCTVVPTDLSKIENIKNLKKKISHLGTVNILINNAGIGSFGPFEELSLDALRQKRLLYYTE